MTMLDHYNNILKHPEIWNYYSHPSKSPFLIETSNSTPRTDNPLNKYESKSFSYFLDDNHAYQFINDYFVRGGKDDTLVDPERVNPNSKCSYQLKMRYIHTLSAFFLGLSIIQKLWGTKGFTFCVRTINDELKKYDFAYVWFLTCLYHDVGYIYELNEKEQKRIVNLIKQHEIIEQFILDLQKESKEDVFLQKLEGGTREQKIIIQFSNNNVQIDNNVYYSEEIIKNYFIYRAVRFGVIDHGIAGGILMYNKLLNIYKTNYINFKNLREAKGIPIPEDSYLHDFENDLLFSPAHLTIWKYISQCIITHNIWKSDKKAEATYKNFDLHELIGEHYKTVSLRSNPLLFLLSLVDTIEPLKSTNCKKEQLDCLQHTQLCVCRERDNKDDIFYLCFTFSAKEKAENLMKSFGDWIELETERKPYEENTLKICFKCTHGNAKQTDESPIESALKNMEVSEK